MRPLRLEMSGFTAYREPVEIDFTDAPYFALVGPTGSGKSSIIDAITFALYGAVPRLDQRSVAPIVSQGSNEARIKLDFSLGETTYTAVRVVRRSAPDRASTKEARLERGEDVLAGDADSVTKAVEDLLGLGFDEFTRCVVLPQGLFARFMHDKPRDRQELLVRLLDLKIYERIGQAANTEASTAEARADVQRARLEGLTFATPEALAAQRARAETLASLMERLDADEERLETLRDELATAKREATEATTAVEALERVRAPADLDQLGAGSTEAQAALTTAEESLAAAEAARAEAETALEALGEEAPMRAALDAHERRARATDDLRTAEAARKGLEADAQTAADALAAATKSLEEAETGREHTRVAHRAADLARTLSAGDDCPVCGQTVHEAPHVDVPGDLEAADAAVAAARSARAEAETRARDAAKLVTAAEAKASTYRETIAGLDATLDGQPTVDELKAQLAARAETDARLRDARAAESGARAAVKDATERLAAAQRQVATAWTTIEAARDTVAPYAPPPLDRDDLAGAWKTLVDWCAEEAERRRALSAAATERAASIEADGSAIRTAQLDACRDAGIEDPRAPRDDCLQALQSSKDTIARIEEALEEAETLRAEVTALEERATVAKALGNHLRASGFERWVLGQAFAVLVEGATQILLELSGGQYSLAMDKSHNFSVVDHRNADAKRSAKTLSGGETFLASLALALALSDRIATLSAKSAVRLESVFIDEGFGALDPETLEVVRGAIEALAARNRTVGIVTHIRALADEIPVRFEVRKGPTSSSVDKVLA